MRRVREGGIYRVEIYDLKVLVRFEKGFDECPLKGEQCGCALHLQHPRHLPEQPRIQPCISFMCSY